MFYRLLGMLVWNGGKVLLRQKYGRTYMPKSALFAGLTVIGLLLLAAWNRSSDA
jgi:hypothetical protein